MYLPALSGGYVWDDAGLVLHNRLLDEPTWEGVFQRDLWAGVEGVRSPYYRPMMIASLLVDRALGGSPAVAHAHSVVWHLVAVWLLARLARLGPGLSPVALGAVAWWALHPVNSEAVVWIAARNDVLVAVGVMGALVLAEVPTLGRLAGVCLLGLFALLAKESGVLAIPLYVAWRWCRRLPVERGPIVALVAAAAMWARLRAGADLGALPTIDATAAWTPDRVASLALRVLSWATIPWPLTASAGGDAPVTAGVVVGALASAMGAVWILAKGGRRGAALLAMAALSMGLAVASARGLGLVGERFLYLPLALVALAMPPPPMLVRCALPAVLVAWVAALLVRIPEWRDDRTLFAAAAGHLGDSYSLHRLAGAELRAGNADRALAAWDAALRARPPARAACRPSVEVARALLGVEAFVARLPLWTEGACRTMDGFDGLVATHLVAEKQWDRARAWVDGSTEPDPAGRVDAARYALAVADGDVSAAAALDLASGGALRDRVATILRITER